MKNAILSLLIGIAVTSFFSFTNGRARLITDEYSEDDDSYAALDTIPKKKDAKKQKSKTVPYDSFGKPKKMDSTTHL